jgi:hypothetical protein
MFDTCNTKAHRLAWFGVSFMHIAFSQLTSEITILMLFFYLIIGLTSGIFSGIVPRILIPLALASCPTYRSIIDFTILALQCCLRNLGQASVCRILKCSLSTSLWDTRFSPLRVWKWLADFWGDAPCSLVEVYRCFRGFYCSHRQNLIVEAASTSETPVKYQTTRRNNFEGSHLYTLSSCDLRFSRLWVWRWFIALMMEAVQTSETLVNVYQCTRRYNPEYSYFLPLLSLVQIFSWALCFLAWLFALNALLQKRKFKETGLS